MYPQSGPSSIPQRPTSTAEEERIALFKQNTNFRSVTRNDPSVVEILETSVYSVIYLYDEAAGAWEKQKQEGPLFIVRRDKAPEYALYMLNRQAVKNVTMPLIPGEMKASIVDPTTLQIARRGEKVKRGIWFSDGAEDVERFRQTILRICGEPVKKPGGVSPAVQPPVIPAISSTSVQATPPSDGLSRLFAGLTTTSGTPTPSRSVPVQEPSYSPSPIPRVVQPQPSYTPIESAPSVMDQRTQSQELASGASHYHEPTQSPYIPVSQPPSQPPTATSPPMSEATPFTPGQTVDDLLMSILGVASPPPIMQPPPPPQTAHREQASIVTAQMIPPVQSPPLPPPNPITSTRVGNASFAQAAGATSPIPPTTRPNLMTSIEAEIFRNESLGAHSPEAMMSTPRPVQNDPSPRQPPASAATPSIDQMLPQMLAGSARPVHPMVDAVVQPLVNRSPGGGMRPVNQVDEAGKRAFVQDLLHLIHTDHTFVDEVWRVFLARTQPGPR